MIYNELIDHSSTTPVVYRSITVEATFYAPPLSTDCVTVPSPSLVISANTSFPNTFGSNIIPMLSVGLLAVMVAVPGFVAAISSPSGRKNIRTTREISHSLLVE
jgi:hypothetical protein